ncbi:hypothetical protein SAMN05443253_101378 [Bacillus sp. OK048]|nr:hypothetical protein SAMN05443253_101378 [Bacillus sp. OK048]
MESWEANGFRFTNVKNPIRDVGIHITHTAEWNYYMKKSLRRKN